MASFTGDLNEMSTDNTFLLSVQALLGDLTSSLSTENISTQEVQQHIHVWKWKGPRESAHLATFKHDETGKC